MVEKYDVQAIINDLKKKGEMDPEKHDGCYELLRETVHAYARLNDFSVLDYKDLNLVYLTTVGTWSHGLDAKKKMVNECNLTSDDKEYLSLLWDKVWEKAGRGEYTNYEASAKEGRSIGLFGTGFFSFKRKNAEPSSEQVQNFIRMLIDILPMEDDEQMFSRAEDVLNTQIPGMQAAAASMILHCLKPYSFPILNSNTGFGNIFEVVGVKLTRTSSLDTYIDNCRKIKAFRDQNFTCKNYRAFDVEAQKMGEFAITDSSEKRAWLLTWNKNNWNWEGYSDKCASTQNGRTITESWTCANTNPKLGDEVFLIKLGEQPRCLIGHGFVVKESYESDHYDPEKAAAGKKSNHIDVEFDRLLDYEKDKCVSQDELNDKCREQYWSPQSSGIEIKPEVLPALYALWGVDTRDTEQYNFASMERIIAEGIFKKEENNQMVQFDHNTILYGPPGTGKTYNSVIYAVAICEGKPFDEVRKEPYRNVLLRYNDLRDAGRIAFTTFHQSYGYEEFIEGIKPKLGVENETLGYIIEDGVFKAFCNHAKTVKVQAATGAQMKPEPRIWGMILGGTGMTDLKKQCFENDEIRLGWSEVDDEDIDGEFVGDDNSSWNAKHMVSDFKNSMEVGDVVVIEKNNKSIDAIGVITGEYVYDKSQGKYPRSRAVEWLVKNIDQDMLQFLPNGRKQLSRFSVFAFDYIGMGVISQILNEYLNDPVMEVEQETKPYVFIIDEINRGNISKIFGELITLIEDTKRAGASEAMEAILPYSGEPFSVPQNVYILGTMNTADRSIALMDTALRRRFEFIEMMPDSNVLVDIGAGKITIGDEELNIARMLDIINKRIEFLFDREHTIGHAFFTKLRVNPSIEALASIFEKNMIPLLQEYFYEDYEKIQLVLGDNTKEDEFKFILDRPVKVQDIFNGNPDIDLPERGYVIQHSAFRKLESYKKIGKDI